MTSYAYTRVSTSQQADEGHSLEIQSRTITGYAMMHGFTVAETFVERGVSGSMPFSDRPEGKRLCGLLRPGDAIIATKLDRMFRDAEDALCFYNQAKRRKISLHLIDLGGDVTGNGMAKFFFTMTSAFAEMERDRIRERIQSVKTEQHKMGHYLGGRVPFGWQRTPDGMLIIDEQQQQAIAFMKEARETGVTLASIQKDVERLYSIRLSLSGIDKIIRRSD